MIREGIGSRLFGQRAESSANNGAHASRLIQVVDSATNQTEVYTWFDDNTLASYPGPGYTRLLDYDEEGRLTRIRKDFGGGNIQLAYEYGYGFDSGRRWRKDYSQNPWTWYPCGVACCAGDLVEMESDLNGVNWTTTAQYLKADSIVRRNSEFHLWDITWKAQVITDGMGATLAEDQYDSFGVKRFSSGASSSAARFVGMFTGEEGMLTVAECATCSAPLDSAIRRTSAFSYLAVIGTRVRRGPGDRQAQVLNRGLTFVCRVPIPPWWQRWCFNFTVHGHWCRACGTACATACPIDDIDCVLICYARQRACYGNGGATRSETTKGSPVGHSFVSSDTTWPSARGSER